MSITSISPLDGRYKGKVADLSPFVSEFALIKTRVEIEIRYLIALSKTRVVKLSAKEKSKLLSLIKNFDLDEAEKIKSIEEEIKHDVKAIEIYLRGKLKSDAAEMIHFGLTSEDINNIVYRLMIRNSSEIVVVPILEKLLKTLFSFSQEFKNVPMLARTHGQPAVPTTLGKEIAVFASRLNLEISRLNKIKLTGKLNGAVGNYNALYFTHPKINWISFSKKFVSSFDLTPNLITTQINSHEDVIEYFQSIQRINGILLDLDQDFWRYISDGWLTLASEKNQVGSSTMPQKINPIDFENSEGNLELANGLIEVMTRRLAVSRLQRDLSNSTIIRNVGTVFGYSLIAYKGMFSGVSKIKVNKGKILEDLNEDWSILSEALQTILRLENVKDSYSKVLEKTKGKHFGEKEWKNLVHSLKISKTNKQKLLKLTPSTYFGLAGKLSS